MSESLRILSVGAHPADIFDQSGGTMATPRGAATMFAVSSSRTVRASTIRSSVTRFTMPARYPPPMSLRPLWPSVPT